MATLLLCTNAILNGICFRRPRAAAHPTNEMLPFVSILVPARNEEDNIEACVSSLLALNYPNFEVLVLDDRSSDRTYEVLSRIRERDYRLRILVGSEPPHDWFGKPHACWQLAQAARGDCLLLTDADCRLRPDAVLLALGAAAEHNADLVSLVPDLECVGFWETLLLPLFYYGIFAFVPTPLIRNSRNALFAAANGAFLFLKKETYFEIGGHHAVRQELAEDLKLAQHAKREGKTVWYGDGTRTYSVRMYSGLPEIWSGFSKNAFAAFSDDLPVYAGSLFAATCLFILPASFAVWGLWHDCAWTIFPIVSFLALAIIRVALSLRFRQESFVYALLNPLAWAIVLGIAVNSAYCTLSRQGSEWKGRIYVRT